MQFVETQLAFGPRVPGTAGHAAMAKWLDSTLSTLADTVLVQRWQHVTRAGDTLPLENVLGRFNPASSQRLLFLAHWDTRPRADGPNAAGEAGPVPGANDGASGTAVLVAVALALASQPPAIGVDLLFVDGEDYGVFADSVDVLMGSRYYASHLPPGPLPDFAVLLDMVGDKNLEIFQEGYSLIAATDVVDHVWNVARDLGYGSIFVPRSKHTVADDHVPLQRAGIRAINVIDFDYPYWHTIHDTIDKLSVESLQAVGEVVLGLIHRAER